MSRERRLYRAKILLGQIILLSSFLAFWQWAPSIGFLRSHFTFFDPFYISSPHLVASKLVELVTGRDDFPVVWPYLWATLKASLIGTAVGIAIGASAGLVLSQTKTAYRILAPFITVLNATPRVAIIPIVIIIAGPTPTASAITAVTVVAFIVFFNAFEGGRQIPIETVQNAQLFGARGYQIMLHVRLPYVIAWTFASLPNAIAFGIVSAVTAEILSGGVGLGGLLSNAVNTVDATLTFAIVTILAAVGALLVISAERMRRRFLHWWPGVNELNV